MNARKPLILSTKNYNNVPEFTEFEDEADLKDRVGSDSKFKLGQESKIWSGKRHDSTSVLLWAEELPLPVGFSVVEKDAKAAKAAAEKARAGKWEERKAQDRVKEEEFLLKLFEVDGFRTVKEQDE